MPSREFQIRRRGIPLLCSVSWLSRDIALRVENAPANRVPFSLMEGDTGWAVNFNPSSRPITSSYGLQAGLRRYESTMTASASGQEFAFASSRFRLNPGERVSVQARLLVAGTAPGSWRIDLVSFDASDAATLTTVASGTGARSFAPTAAFVTVPAGAVSGYLQVVAGSSGAGTVQTLIAEPMVALAAVGQTVHPAFIPGPTAVESFPSAPRFVWLGQSLSAAPSLTGAPAGATYLNFNESTFVTRGGLKMRAAAAFGLNSGFASAPYAAIENTFQRIEFELAAGNWEAAVIVQGDASNSGTLKLIDDPAGAANERYSFVMPVGASRLIDTDGTQHTTAGTAVANAFANLTYVPVTISNLGSGVGLLRITSPASTLYVSAIALRQLT